MRNEERAAMRAGMAQEEDTGVLDLPEAEKKEMVRKATQKELARLRY